MNGMQVQGQSFLPGDYYIKTNKGDSANKKITVTPGMSETDIIEIIRDAADKGNTSIAVLTGDPPKQLTIDLAAYQTGDKVGVGDQLKMTVGFGNTTSTGLTHKLTPQDLIQQTQIKNNYTPSCSVFRFGLGVGDGVRAIFETTDDAMRASINKENKYTGYELGVLEGACNNYSTDRTTDNQKQLILLYNNATKQLLQSLEPNAAITIDGKTYSKTSSKNEINNCSLALMKLHVQKLQSAGTKSTILDFAANIEFKKDASGNYTAVDTTPGDVHPDKPPTIAIPGKYTPAAFLPSGNTSWHFYGGYRTVEDTKKTGEIMFTPQAPNSNGTHVDGPAITMSNHDGVFVVSRSSAKGSEASSPLTENDAYAAVEQIRTKLNDGGIEFGLGYNQSNGATITEHLKALLGNDKYEKVFGSITVKDPFNDSKLSALSVIKPPYDTAITDALGDISSKIDTGNGTAMKIQNTPNSFSIKTDKSHQEKNYTVEFFKTTEGTIAMRVNEVFAKSGLGIAQDTNYGYDNQLDSSRTTLIGITTDATTINKYMKMCGYAP